MNLSPKIKVNLGFYRIFLFSMVTVLLSSNSIYAYSGNNFDTKASPNVNTIDFLKSPVDYLADIYKDYHDWRVDSGLKKCGSALQSLSGMASDDELEDSRLKLKKVYQIKSTLLTLQGMFYYRKFLSLEQDGRKKMHAPILEKLKKGKNIEDDDLDSLASNIEKKEEESGREKYYHSAVNTLQSAITTDPSNPTPHFQAGTIYSAVSVDGDTEKAEKEFFTAAKLSLLERDKKSAERAMKALKNINPDSVYIEQFEKLSVGPLR